MTKLKGGISGYYNALDRIYRKKSDDSIPSNPNLEYSSRAGFTINSGLVPIPADTIRLGQICYWNDEPSHPQTASAYREVRDIILDRTEDNS